MVINHFREKINSLEELRKLYKMPGERALMKQLSSLDYHSRKFIALSPFVLIATANSSGNCDVSPRGDKHGFVEVLDENHLVFPDRPGNNRLDSLTNLLENPHIGMLFLIPGRADTLRVNGKAWIVRDKDLLEKFFVNGSLPKTVIGIKVEEVFLHCQRAFMRSQLWQPETWVDENNLPSFCEILWEQFPKKPAEFANAKEYETTLDALNKENLY